MWQIPLNIQMKLILSRQFEIRSRKVWPFHHFFFYGKWNIAISYVVGLKILGLHAMMDLLLFLLPEWSEKGRAN